MNAEAENFAKAATSIHSTAIHAGHCLRCGHSRKRHVTGNTSFLTTRAPQTKGGVKLPGYQMSLYECIAAGGICTK